MFRCDLRAVSAFFLFFAISCGSDDDGFETLDASSGEGGVDAGEPGGDVDAGAPGGDVDAGAPGGDVDADAPGGDVDAGAPGGGGEVVDGTVESTCRAAAPSPRSTYLEYSLCGHETGTYVHDLGTNERYAINDRQSLADSLVFTPDESRVVYLEDETIVTTRYDGSGRIELYTSAGGPINWIKVTPDGQRVYWSRNRNLLSSIAIDGSDGEAVLVDFSDEATLLPAQNSAFATPDSSALIFKADGVSAPLFAVPLDGSAPAAQLGSEDQLTPAFETLTDTHLIVSYADGGSTLAELNLADGSLLDIGSAFEPHRYASGHVFWLLSFTELWHWAHGESLPAEALAANVVTDSVQVTADGERVVWASTAEGAILSRPSDARTDAISLLELDDGAHAVVISPDGAWVLVTDGTALRIAAIDEAGSGVEILAEGVSRTDPIGFNGTSTHAIFMKPNADAFGSELWAVDVSGGIDGDLTPVQVHDEAYKWSAIPGRAAIYFHSDVDDVTDSLANLHIVTP